MNQTKSTSKLLDQILWKSTILSFIKHIPMECLYLIVDRGMDEKTDEYDETGTY
jgi:hypothetical protein